MEILVEIVEDFASVGHHRRILVTDVKHLFLISGVGSFRNKASLRTLPPLVTIVEEFPLGLPILVQLDTINLRIDHRRKTPLTDF